MTTRPVVAAPGRDIRAACTLRAVRVLAALVVLVPVLASGLEAQDAQGRVTGVRVRVVNSAGDDLRGELLGLRDENIWVLAGEREEERRFVPLPLTDLKEVRMQRHGWSGGRIALWTALAGGATTVAMFGACTSIEDSGSCAAVAGGWAGLWAVIGGFTRLVIGPSWKTVRAPALDELRPYARFPQGLPDGYPPRADDRVPH